MLLLKSKNFRIVAVIAILVSIFYGCQTTLEQDLAPAKTTNQIDGNLPNLEGIEIQFEQVTRAIVPIMENAEFRVLVKDIASIQFDGDYDVLMSQIIKHQFSDGQTLRQKLDASFAEVHNLSAKEAATEVSNILKENPLLTLSVPVNIEKWNAEEEFIPVVTRPLDGGEKGGVTHLKGYKQGMEEILLPIEAAPDFPVLAIGENERVYANGEVKDGMLNLPGEASSPKARSFSAGQRVELWQVNCPDLGSVESWIAGKPEFFCSVRGGTVVTSSVSEGYIMEEFHFTGKRNQFDPGDWFVLDKYIINRWDNDDPGKNLSLTFMEEDGGVPAKFKLKLFEIEVDPSSSVSWWPSWLKFNVGPELTIEELGKNTTGMGTATCRRDDTCWTDYYTGSTKNAPKSMRFYLNCP
ncbi:MAG: hypothetical protein MRZ79_17215 [Bacteroidia bacterium]|nr:hypothetical protein [Bacteroidia bacterium]